MSESKVFMFPEQGNNSNLMAMLTPLLQQRNIDPGMLALMNNGNGFGGNQGGWFMWVIFLFFLMGWGRNSFGNGLFGGNGYDPQMAGLANQLNNDSGRELLMQAINGNGDAVRSLASTLNCDINAIQSSLNNLQSSICNVGNQVGMSSQQIINAIQSGNCQIGNQLAQCCCTIQDAITRQGYENQIAISNQTNTLQNGIVNSTNVLSNSLNNLATGQERGFSNVLYETQRQTCEISNNLKDAVETITSGQRAAELREMQNKIDSLRELNSQKDVIINNGQQTAMFSQMINQATAPLATALNSLQSDINGVKCKLPETTTIQYSPVVGVPACVAYNNAFGNAALGLNNWNTCGCTNTLWG